MTMDNGVAGCLAVPGPGATWHGRVRAVFARSVHVALGAGCLTLGDASLPAHPCSILWPGFPDAWAVGQPVTVTAGGVFGQDGLLVSLDALGRFTPSRRCRPMAAPEPILAALAASQDRAAALPATGGFHEVFLRRLRRPAPPGATSRLAGSFADLGLRLCARLARALRRRQWEGFERAARAIVGLGVGLTPAGDDFLAGVLAALRYHGESLGRPVLRQGRLTALAGRLAGGTTDFSGFLLRCAAEGLVAGPVDDWLAAVHGGRAGQAAGGVSDLAGLGHSSGLDTLSGMLLAMQILMGERPWTQA